MARVTTHLQSRGFAGVGLHRLERFASAIVAAAILLLVVYSNDFPSLFMRRPAARDLARQVRPLEVRPLTPVDPEAPSAPRDGEQPEELALQAAQENREKAEREVVRAAVAYKNMEWRNCVQRLEAARALDPVAGSSPALMGACVHEAESAMDAKAPRRR